MQVGFCAEKGNWFKTLRLLFIIPTEKALCLEDAMSGDGYKQLAGLAARSTFFIHALCLFVLDCLCSL